MIILELHLALVFMDFPSSKSIYGRQSNYFIIRLRGVFETINGTCHYINYSAASVE